jgi:hypothetical protein
MDKFENTIGPLGKYGLAESRASWNFIIFQIKKLGFLNSGVVILKNLKT